MLYFVQILGIFYLYIMHHVCQANCGQSVHF